jgi:HK97 family phage prohead protease
VSEHTPAPREHIIRARPELQFRAAGDTEEGIGDGYLGLLRIRFSPVGEWTEINSSWEGRFMERFAPNAWKKTIKERGDKIRSLFQHGRDPQIGDKPLGPFHRLEEDDQGGYAEVKLLDTSYNRDLLPGLKEGLYGASHASVSSRRRERPPGAQRPQPERDQGSHDQGGPAPRARAGDVPRLRGRDVRDAFDDGRVPPRVLPQRPGPPARDVRPGHKS